MTAVLVVAFALATALAAQIVIPLPFTPVPITGQTFTVLLAGAALGANAGAASMGLYLVLGAIGLPFYAGGTSGWTVVQGATGGYLVGFIVAAWLIGALAERLQDRTIVTAIPAFLMGSVIIHVLGVPWLAASLDIGWIEAASLGSVPFIPGDLLKVAAAGLMLPAAWKLAAKSGR
jgi:biotin transport system substrate-specific component